MEKKDRYPVTLKIQPYGLSIVATVLSESGLYQLGQSRPFHESKTHEAIEDAISHLIHVVREEEVATTHLPEQLKIRRCHYCEHPIDLQKDHQVHPAEGDREELRFHPACFEAWV